MRKIDITEQANQQSTLCEVGSRLGEVVSIVAFDRIAIDPVAF
jgi:hypothetical protein